MTDYVRDSTETTLYWRWVGAIIWAISASIPSLAFASGEVIKSARSDHIVGSFDENWTTEGNWK